MDVKKSIRSFIRLCLRLHPHYRRKIVLFMDGGICSQMKVYVIGQLLAKKGNDVYYDISAIENGAKDCDNNLVRNFDLLKLYPTIHFKKWDNHNRKFWIKYLRNFHDYSEDAFDYLNTKAPCYMVGYYEIPDNEYKKLKTFFPEPVAFESEYIEKINDCKISCGVHVRRGDLKNGNPAYGKPASSQYFINAINKINDMYSSVKFFFFSDEIDYVKNEIIPKCSGIDFECVEGNGSDKGYLDLLLLSMCNFQISSIGSFGKFAALLNGKTPRGLVIMDTPESIIWCGRYDGDVIIIENTDTNSL